jgi:predicted secreted acid phosphatase
VGVKSAEPEFVRYLEKKTEDTTYSTTRDEKWRKKVTIVDLKSNLKCP